MDNTTLLEMPTGGLEVPESDPGPNPGFSRLLDWLDSGVDSCGERYLEMRRRLIAYFERRNCQFADDLADETLDRIARTLHRDGTIAVTPQARYCYVVARFVFLEDMRRQRWRLRLPTLESTDDESSFEYRASREERLEFLDRCLQELRPDQRALIVEYYRDTGRKKIERRRDLAKRLSITANALGNRASRLRASLEARMAQCHAGSLAARPE
jgi:DNA-directed RNA polymerase specialized sigma24 family protein